MATPNSLLVTQLYVGYFNRAPDPAGLNYWVGRLEAGMTLVEIANSFAVQTESTTTYPWLAAPNLDVGIDQFITSVYQNLFERAPDAAGLAFWRAELIAGKPPGRFILDVISGAQGDDKLVIQHKTEVGNYYTDQALLRGLDWNVADDLTGATAVLDGDRAFWVSAASVATGKANADAIITEQLTPTPGFIELTTGVDNVTVGANETVLGNDLTWNPGDRITGKSGTVDINYGAAAGPFFGTITNVDLVNLTTQGPTFQSATLWTDVDHINVKQSTGALRLDDLQATSNDAASGTGFTTYSVRDYVTGNTVTFNFDIQAANAGNTVVDLGVSEVTGGILLNSGVGGDLETVQMHIEDVAGATSKIASFSAQGIQTLKIDGGTAGLAFEIIAPLDAGLKTIDAATAASNLTLDVSKSTENMKITLGTGNDLLKTGDTLGPIIGGNDTLVGGSGTDTVEAIFTTSGTRQPVMSGFEVANVTFNNNAVWNFADTNDLHTINVASSTHRIALEDMDGTVSTINVTGLQAPGAPGGPGTARHDFWFVDGKDLTMNWKSAVKDDTDAGELYFRGIPTVTFNHSGPFDTFFRDSIPDGDDSVFQFDDALVNLTINNKGLGDLYLLGGDGDETIAATKMMRTLAINATGGDIAISGDVDTILNLRTLALSAAGGNYLALDDIGTPVDDINGGTGFGERLEIVTVTTGSNSTIDMDELRADRSSISTFTVTAGNDSDIIIEDIHAQDISEMNVTLEEESFFRFDGGEDIFMVNQGDNLVVTGAGKLGAIDFDTEAFRTMNFSGMTVFGVDIDFQDAKAASIVTGTSQNDIFEAGSGADTINSGLGSDNIDGNAGNDVITSLGGAGTTTFIRGGLGLDTINITGPGTDFVIVGHQGPANFDTVNGFNIATDWLLLDLGNMGGNAVNGAGVALVPDNDPNLQTVFTAGAPGVPNINPASEIFLIEGQYATLGSVETAINFTGSRALIASTLIGNPDVGEQLIIGWQDLGGNFHVSAAEITNEIATSLTTQGYNFHLDEMAVITGVPALATLEFQLIA